MIPHSDSTEQIQQYREGPREAGSKRSLPQKWWPLVSRGAHTEHAAAPPCSACLPWDIVFQCEKPFTRPCLEQSEPMASQPCGWELDLPVLPILLVGNLLMKDTDAVPTVLVLHWALKLKFPSELLFESAEHF